MLLNFVIISTRHRHHILHNLLFIYRIQRRHRQLLFFTDEPFESQNNMSTTSSPSVKLRNNKFVVIQQSSQSTNYHLYSIIFFVLTSCFSYYSNLQQPWWEKYLIATGLPALYLSQISTFVDNKSFQLSVLVCMVISFMLWKGHKRVEVQNIVETTPLGVQLTSKKLVHVSSTSSYSTQEKSIFLPQEDISDVIVNEMVLSYKVFSHIVFRVCVPEDNDKIVKKDYQKSDGTEHIEGKKEISSEEECCTGDENQIQMKLIPAFPDLTLTYDECLKLWEGIMISLGKL